MAMRWLSTGLPREGKRQRHIARPFNRLNPTCKQRLTDRELKKIYSRFFWRLSSRGQRFISFGGLSYCPHSFRTACRMVVNLSGTRLCRRKESARQLNSPLADGRTPQRGETHKPRHGNASSLQSQYRRQGGFNFSRIPRISRRPHY